MRRSRPDVHDTSTGTCRVFRDEADSVTERIDAMDSRTEPPQVGGTLESDIYCSVEFLSGSISQLCVLDRPHSVFRAFIDTQTPLVLSRIKTVLEQRLVLGNLGLESWRMTVGVSQSSIRIFRRGQRPEGRLWIRGQYFANNVNT